MSYVTEWQEISNGLVYLFILSDDLETISKAFLGADILGLLRINVFS